MGSQLQAMKTQEVVKPELQQEPRLSTGASAGSAFKAVTVRTRVGTNNHASASICAVYHNRPAPDIQAWCYMLRQ